MLLDWYLLLKKIFDYPLLAPGHSPVGFIEPIKNDKLTEEQIELYKKQIRNYNNKTLLCYLDLVWKLFQEEKN